MKKIKKIKSLSVILAVLVFVFAFATVVTASEEAAKYGITTLSEKEAYVYNKLVSGINKDVPDSSVKLESSKEVSVEELRVAYTAFVSDYPECFWVTNGYTYSTMAGRVVSVQPSYTFSSSELPEARAKLNAAVDNIIGGMRGETVFEKALYLHDAVAKAVEYKEVGHHQTAYGALVDGRAVCAGYAAAYQLLLQKAGIRSYTVTGNSKDPSTGIPIPHAWNLVWLDSDTCVYTDVTWDDQGESLYRYYFNLSYDEIKKDHFENEELFTLPECHHTESSYFDTVGGSVNEESSVTEVAALFGEARDGVRTAALYYEGEDFGAWLTENISALYDALGGGVGSYGYSTTFIGKEYHVTVNGSFPVTSYFVDVVAPEGMNTDGNTEQSVECESAMTDIVYNADTNYYFPESYSDLSVNGITVTRISYATVVISGTPTADTVITLPPPTLKEKKATPTASFSATEGNSGILSAPLDCGWLYSLDGGANWTALTDEQTALTNVKAEWGIKVIAPSDSVSLASDEQLIDVRPLKTTVSFEVVKASAEGTADGKITVVGEGLEYRSADSSEWIAVTDGEITGLAAGIYYLRYRADGSSVASESTEVTVKVVCVHANTKIIPEKTADCQNDGHAEYKVCLDCGDVVEGNDEAIKGTHVFGEWVVTKEAAFGVDGEMEKTCTVCGETETQKTPPQNVSDLIARIVNEHSKAVYTVAGIILLLIFIRIVFKKKK